MTQAIFNERIKRIQTYGPSSEVIPGQVGEPDRKTSRKMSKVRKPRTPRETILTSLLFGGILGAIAGLFFQEIVGVEALMTLDWQAEFALIQDDLVRMATWITIALGLAVFVVTLPARKKFRKLAGWSFAYIVTAVGVNAQELIALVPADTLLALAG